MKIIDRTTKQIKEEKVPSTLKFLYNTKLGRIILKIITKKPLSKLNSYLIKSPLSKIYIKHFIKVNNINMDEYELKKYSSFDDFFTRKIKKAKRPISNNLPSICDSNLTAYKIDKNLILNIKKSKYSLEELTHMPINDKYKDGICLVFRLTPQDYHHYIYLDDGILLNTHLIEGILHTVNPISFDNYKVFTENERQVNILKTKNYDEVIQIEVGALNIGKINNYNKKTFKKGEEKGYFSFGGSTIILLFKNNIVKIDEDILINTKQDIETKVKMGEKIGIKVLNK